MSDTYSSKPYGKEVFERLEELGVVQHGHFVNARTGQHEKVRVEKDLLFPSAVAMSDFAEIISMELIPERIDTVIGAGPAGAAIANQVADWLNVSGQQAFAIYAERYRHRALRIPKAQERFVDLVQRVVIVVGILDSSFQMRQLIQLIRDLDGDLWGIAAIWNSSGLTAEDFGVENLFSICGEEFTTWYEVDCPLCAEDVPITPAPSTFERTC